MKKIFFALIVISASLNLSAQPLVKVDGSSTVFPIIEGIAEDFQKQTKNRVTVGVSGTGGGFKKFCRGEIDVVNASRPILKNEMEACKQANINYYELPIAFDALTVVIDPTNNFVKQLSVTELKKMWEPSAQGKVTTWDQVNPSFPKVPLRLFGAGSDSGTFDYFTEAIMGKAKSSRGDYTATEDDNVTVTGVQKNRGALGYFGYAYFAEHKDKIKAVPIVNNKGVAVSPSEESVMNGSYNPLARPVFVYVKSDSMNKNEVKTFVEYLLNNAAKVSKEVKYIPLPPAVYKANMMHLQNKRTGTIFNGQNEVGMTIQELMKREAK